MADRTQHNSWWTTLPGVLTAVAGVITAITGLIIALSSPGGPTPITEQPPPITEPLAPPSEAKDTLDPEPGPDEPQAEVHCERPSRPVLILPRRSLATQHAVTGGPHILTFSWSKSECEGGTIKGYELMVFADDEISPMISEFVRGTRYTGPDVSTLAAEKLKWKVRAVDDRERTSGWSETRQYTVPARIGIGKAVLQRAGS